MIVLDTTVLIYAVGTEHPFRAPCRRLVEAIAGGDVAATTTVEVIQEFAHVRARRRGRADAAALANDYVELLAPLLVVDEADVRDGMRIFTESPTLGCFDSVLAAAAAAAEAAALVSADAAFAVLSSVRHIVPDETGVAELLGPL